ncbi:OTU domain-containing protein [Camellia lanceoleosa]|nr:OTU domain-containing protein [Camellia lanceoleosa]
MDLLSLCQLFIEGDFDAYVERIRQHYIWGREPELLMASHVLKSCGNDVNLLVLQGIVDSIIKDTSTVHSVRKETVENVAFVLWKTATGADVREQKANVSSILKELRSGNANVGAIAAKLNAVDVKLETLMGNFNIPIALTSTSSVAVAVPPPTSSIAPSPPPPTNGDGNGGDQILFG